MDGQRQGEVGGEATVLVRKRFHVADICRGPITGLCLPGLVLGEVGRVLRVVRGVGEESQ